MAKGLMIFQGIANAVTPRQKALNSVPSSDRGWYPLIREAFAGAWQRDVKVDRNAVLAYHAVFACVTLIASDIAKLRVKLVQQSNGIWAETTSPSYSPVLRKPNHYQNRIQFWESWIISKLNKGNTYVLKERDNRNVVVALYILDPELVQPMISDDGSVFYKLSIDNLSGVTSDVLVPASEIIHDRMNCLFHPLVGISPLFANGLAATQGLNIQKNSIRLFENNSTPGGILTAPGEIGDSTAERLKADWEENFSGKNVGKVAVLGDGLKYERMALTAVENQMIEQLKLTAEIVCSTYHVPGYKIGVGPVPNVSNVQSLNVEYYSQCLQRLIEDAELCLDEGLEMKADIGTEFDTDNLLRMDSVTQMDVLDKGKNILKPDEARKKLDLPPVAGGNAVYRQQQDFSLEALAKRDARDDPFAKTSPAPTAPPAADPANDNAEQERALVALFEKDLREALNA